MAPRSNSGLAKTTVGGALDFRLGLHDGWNPSESWYARQALRGHGHRPCCVADGRGALVRVSCTLGPSLRTVEALASSKAASMWRALDFVTPPCGSGRIRVCRIRRRGHQSSNGKGRSKCSDATGGRGASPRPGSAIGTTGRSGVTTRGYALDRARCRERPCVCLKTHTGCGRAPPGLSRMRDKPAGGRWSAWRIATRTGAAVGTTRSRARRRILHGGRARLGLAGAHSGNFGRTVPYFCRGPAASGAFCRWSTRASGGKRGGQYSAGVPSPPTARRKGSAGR